MTRCHICDTKLSDNETKYEKDFKAYAPCFACLKASGVSVSNTIQDVIEALYAAVDSEGDKTNETKRPPQGETSLS